MSVWRHLGGRAYPWLLGSYVGAVAATILVGLVITPRLASDAYQLSLSAHALADCARSGAWHGCDGADRFGLVQHLLALPLAFAGVGAVDMAFVLTLISFASAAFLVFVLIATFGTRAMRGRVALLVILAGPLVVYAALPFAETLQSLVFVCLVIAVRRNRTGMIVLLAAVAASTRETASVALVPLVIAAALAARPPSWSRLVAGGAGIVAGLAALAAFNIWRFGTVSNPLYARAEYVTPGSGLRAEMFAGIWVSPSGGVIAFWFIGAVASLGLSVAVLADRASPARARWAAASNLGALAVTSVGLALWYSPFGAVAWGPRLMIPVVAATSVTSMYFARPTARRMLDWVRRHRMQTPAAVLLTAGTVLTTLPSIGALVGPNLTADFLAVPVAGFDECKVSVDAANYFECLRAAAWQLWPSQILRGLQQVASPAGIALSALLLALVAASVASVTYSPPSMRLARSTSLRRR